MHLSTAVLILLSYLIGSVNSAILISMIFRLPSPRSIGSGNPGATNVLRSGGKLPAALTLFFDLIKGVIFIVAARMMHEPMLIWMACGLAAVIGHTFPIFFKFQGGKGVATSIGVCLAMNIWLGLCFIWIWLVMAAVFRYSSLSALVAIICMPIIGYFLLSPAIAGLLLIMALLVIIRHRENIKRLIQGKESKLGQKKAA